MATWEPDIDPFDRGEIGEEDDTPPFIPLQIN